MSLRRFLWNGQVRSRSQGEINKNAAKVNGGVLETTINTNQALFEQT